MPGPRLKETIDYLSNLLGKVREFSKPTADLVDRMPVFREDAGRLRQLITDHGAWVANARLLIGNRNFALRQVLEKRTSV